MNPKQVALIPVSEAHIEFAEKVKNRLLLEGFFAEVEYASLTLNKKIRNAQIAQFNFIAVIGNSELESKSVDVRDRDSNSSIGKFSIGDFVRFLKGHLLKNSEVRDHLISNAYYDDIVEVTQSIRLPLLNETLERSSFVNGQEISVEDWRIHKALKSVDSQKYPHIARWYNHLKSISS